jgi:hypothetical protein
MYSDPAAMQFNTGVIILQEIGISSDHNLVISKFDFGMKKFDFSSDKEERIDFRRIMNIPVAILTGEEHPTLSDKVFKGNKFRHHKALYKSLQNIAKDPALQLSTRIEGIHHELSNNEQHIISRTMNTITPEVQDKGKSIQRTPADAEFINNISVQFFFETINDISRHAKLAKMVYTLPAASIQDKKT